MPAITQLSAAMWTRIGAAIVLAGVIAAVAFVMVPRLGASVTSYTSDADFDLGTLQGVNHDAPNSNQLQISSVTSTFPVMWIANAGEDTVSKIDTDTGQELARYRTWFNGPTHGAWSGPAPSRTAVDADGNVYVANRHFDNRPPLVMKILASGGIDRNGNGVIDTSTDADNSGTIGAGEIIALSDSNPNGILDASELADERVAWAVTVGGNNHLGRSLCIAPDGNIWLGTYNARQYWELDPANGSVLSGPYWVSEYTPYGCAVDASGILWSATLSGNLGRLDTSTGASSVKSYASNYGIAVGNGKVYTGGSGNSFQTYDPVTSTFSLTGTATGTTGIAVDGSGNIFVGNYTMQKFSPAGALQWSSPHPSGWYSHGVVIDGNGDVWGVNLYNNRVSKWNGATGAYINSYPVGLSPYTYSDATGIGALTTTPTGYWTIVQDGSTVGHEWGTITWNTEPEGNVPAGASLTVEARAADTQAGLDFVAYTPVSNGVAFTMLGRYIQVRVKFVASADGTSPVLSDLSIADTEVAPPPETDGFMTGGGNVTIGAGKAAKRYTWGFTIRCDASEGNFQYNDHAANSKFHLESITSVECTDDPDIDPSQPGAAFDTLHLVGTGRWNGVSGATIDATLQDAGEPGTNDTADITISAGSVVVDTVLTGGNNQAHDE